MTSHITAAATLAAALLGTSAQAFEVKHAQSGERVRWHRPTVTWTVHRSVKELRGAEDAIAAATKAWTQQRGGPVVAIASSANGGKSSKTGLAPGFDGNNAIFYVKDGFEPAGTALAVTLLSFDDRTGEVLDADIVLNGKYKLGVIARGAKPRDPDEKEMYDVGRIVAHEMGHALALSDEPEHDDALMYPYVARAVALATTPGSDDLAGLAKLYDTPPAGGSTVPDASGDAAGCGAVVARSGPGPLPGVGYGAMGLLVAAVVMARSKRRGGRAAAGCTVFAAAALVMPPVHATGGVTFDRSTRIDAEAREAIDARAVVTAVRTISVDGVFRSEIELTTMHCVKAPCPPVSRAIAWGGTLDGVRQVVGGVLVPSTGDRVGIVLAPRVSSEGIVRAMTRLAE